MILLAAFFAMNMGASGIAPAFSVEYGSGVLSRRAASLLFAFFVLLGAYFLGGRVVKVISGGIIPEELLNLQAGVVIFTATTLSLFLSNLFRIPASTSQITVFSIAGYGYFRGAVEWSLFARLVPLWFALPVAAFLLTYMLGRFLYPRIAGWEHGAIRFWDIATSCYTALSIGSNNVANASGVLVGAGVTSSSVASFSLAPFFGLGGLVLGKGNLESMGKKVTALDMVSASLVSLVTGTFLIGASVLGLPQSLVQLNSFAIFGFGVARKGKGMRKLGKKIIKRSFVIWTLSPILGFFVAFALAFLCGAGRGF